MFGEHGVDGKHALQLVVVEHKKEAEKRVKRPRMVAMHVLVLLQKLNPVIVMVVQVWNLQKNLIYSGGLSPLSRI